MPPEGKGGIQHSPAAALMGAGAGNHHNDGRKGDGKAKGKDPRKHPAKGNGKDNSYCHWFHRTTGCRVGKPDYPYKHDKKISDEEAAAADSGAGIPGGIARDLFPRRCLDLKEAMKDAINVVDTPQGATQE